MIAMAGLYYFLEKKGYVNNILGQIHFWITLIGGYCLFMPTTYVGLAGMPRRYLDYSSSFNRFMGYNGTMAYVAMITLIVQLVFVGMVVQSLIKRFFVR
jgi:cytochrome c oxidase subunit 1